MPERKTILIPLESMKLGGAERTMLNIANHLPADRWRVVLALYQECGAYLPIVHSSVELRVLHCRRPVQAIMPLSRLIGREQPDVVFSTLLYNNAAAVLAARGRVPTVVRESNHQTAAGRSSRSLKERMVRYAYRRASHVIALSDGVLHDCVERYGLPKSQISRIYNPIDLEMIEEMADRVEDRLLSPGEDLVHLLAVGRLVPQKGFDLLLQACALLPSSLPWCLTILGEGPMRAALHEQAERLGISDRLQMPGSVSNPFATMKAADVFILSSRWEGFGHVIAEAMSCGVPVIATRCPSGPDEIITTEVDGILVDPGDIFEMARAIERVATDRALARRLTQAANTSVRRFAVKEIVGQYDELFSRFV